MKTSKAYYERFKTEFLRWRDLLGLTQYRLDFFHEKLEGDYAGLQVYEKEKVVRISITTEKTKDSAKVDEGPESHARHEVFHLLINRLGWLGGCRYITDDDLEEECEAVVVRLEKVLK